MGPEQRVKVAGNLRVAIARLWDSAMASGRNANFDDLAVMVGDKAIAGADAGGYPRSPPS